jgi:2'-5' RNA ligase
VSEASSHRLFFALNPGDRVRRKISKLQRMLDLPGRAVPPSNFHVTLAFLGMQRADVLPAVCDVAGGLKFPECRVSFDRIGHFNRAGVLWLGASEVPGELSDFQHELVGRLLSAEIGYDRKPWTFHLTLYRKLRKRPPTIDFEPILWRLNGFSLVESVRVGSGVEYHDLGHWNAVR